MTPPPTPSADLLLEHSSFLRGLARSLVYDEQRAEDVVQDTYLAALHRPPPTGVRLRAWLGGITRNLSKRTHRTSARVRSRESRAARPEAVTTDDIAERVEIQRRVADAVARLPEPGRTAIVRRFFDGLTPTEIAAEEGVSVRTIESRLRRAREALRAHLDASYGERAVWQAALLPVAGVGASGAGGFEAATQATAKAGVSTATGGGAAIAAGVTVMNLKLTLAVVAVCAVGAFFAGRNLLPALPSESASSDASAPREVKAPTLHVDPSVQQRAAEDLAAARTRNEALTAEVTRLTAALAEARAAAHAEASPTSLPAEAVYGPAEHRKILEVQSWTEAGEAVTKLLPLLDALSDAAATGAKVDQSRLLDIPKWNGPLQQLALGLVQGGMPGTGANGSFSHPAVSVNLIRATLAHAELPLSEKQDERLVTLADTYLAEDARRREGYGADALSLQRTIDEAVLKDRFYGEVDGLMTPEQLAILHPPAVRGRLGVDLFSSGIIWHTLARPVVFRERADLAVTLRNLLMAQYKFTDAEADVVEDAALVWSRAFSDEDMQAFGERVYRKSAELSDGIMAGWQRVDVTMRAARHMLALKQTLLERLPPTSLGAKRLRGGGPLVALPLRK